MGVIAEGIPRGCQGLFTPVSLGYPLSVFNKNSTLKPPRGWGGFPGGWGFFFFWFLVYFAATQLATPLQHRCTQVVRSNVEDRNRRGAPLRPSRSFKNVISFDQSYKQFSKSCFAHPPPVYFCRIRRVGVLTV